MTKKRIYFSDFGNLLTDKMDEVIEAVRGDQFCCHCVGADKDDNDCDCIARKSRQDGTKEHFMSAGMLLLDEACEAVMATARDVVKSLEERSFLCNCPLPSEENKD